MASASSNVADPRNLRFHVEEEGKGVDPEAGFCILQQSLACPDGSSQPEWSQISDALTCCPGRGNEDQQRGVAHHFQGMPLL